MSPLQVLKALTSVPDGTPGVSVHQTTKIAEFHGQNPSDAGKAIEIRPRALALLPLAVVGAFGNKNLLKPSCRARTLKNACAGLNTTAQRVEVLIHVLCALCSRSNVLRTHACSMAAALLSASDSDKANADALEKGVACIAKEICAAKNSLEASCDALQNILVVSKVSSMHELVLHALCPCMASSEELPESISVLLDSIGDVPGVATAAVRSCVTALAMHGPHALGVLFKILCQQVGDAEAAVATHAYVPCIMKHVVALLQAGLPASGLMSLSLAILRSYSQLSGAPMHTQVCDVVSKRMAAMHEGHAFVPCAVHVLRAALDMRCAPKAHGVALPVVQHAHDITASARCVLCPCISVLCASGFTTCAECSSPLTCGI